MNEKTVRVLHVDDEEHKLKLNKFFQSPVKMKIGGSL
jgi:hypothetical protein